MTEDHDVYLSLSGIGSIAEENFTKQAKIPSDSIEKYGLLWKIIIKFHQADSHNYVGIYLACEAENKDCLPCNIQATFGLTNHSFERNFTKIIQHLYQGNDAEGIPNFIQYNELINPKNGFHKDGAVQFFVEIVNITTYVGLKNQGATCYLNSLIQVLFFIKRFRKAIYQMNTENDYFSNSSPLALQYLFYKLQTSDSPVSTECLTNSFGWDHQQCQNPSDVQETCRLLLDLLERKMKGTPVEHTISRLFRGKMESHIKCVNVAYESKTVATFDDLQIKVKGMNDLYSSFKDYCSVEHLCGENQYNAENLGYQDAEKSVAFTELPPVLWLHLIRFEYNPQTADYNKITDGLQYPYILNLDQFLKAPSNKRASYFLFAVISHCGKYGGGHYVVYINPEGDNNWFKFNDHIVTISTEKIALDQNHGSTSYILIYINESDKSDVLVNIEKSDLPASLKRLLNYEKKKRNTDVQINESNSNPDTFICVSCILIDSSLNLISKRNIDVCPNDYVTHMLAKAMSYMPLSAHSSRKLRLLEVVNSRIKKLYSENLLVSNVLKDLCGILRIEEVPLDQINLTDNEIIIFVAHFTHDVSKTFGIPFTLVLKKESTIGELKKNIQYKVSANESDFSQWRLAIVGTEEITYLDDNSLDTPIPHELFFVSKDTWLGIDHCSTAKKPKLDYFS